MNPIKQWWHKKLRETTETRIQDIRADFDIIEEGGSLFLTHRGEAFERIDIHARAEQIAERLETVRLTTIKFRGYGTDPAESETAPV